MPTVSEHPEGMPCWIDASVSTKEAREGLMAFYSDLFGWSFDVNTPETGFYSIARHNGKAVLAIGEQPDGQGRWVTYFSTPDIEAACARAKVEGANVFFPPMQVIDVGWMALVMDPTGVVHGFWQPITFPGFEIQYELNTPGWFDHVSADTQRASKYYSKILSKEIETATQEGMQILQRGDWWFASFSDLDANSQTPQWTPILIVESLDAFRKRVRELGGTIIVEEIPVPGSAISIFKDPIIGGYMTVMKAGVDPNSGN